jgi:hypothetical protein
MNSLLATVHPYIAQYGYGALFAVLFAESFGLPLPGETFLVAASFLLGLTSQSFKICTDTLVQAHIEDSYKGRVFVVYDMIFNAALVCASVIAAVVLPADGVSGPIFLGLSAAYVILAVGFTLVTRRMGSATFDRGTESTRGAAVEPVS